MLHGKPGKPTPGAYAVESKGKRLVHASAVDTPQKCFDLCFPPEIIRNMVTETNRYAFDAVASANRKRRWQEEWLDTTEDELRVFHGLLVVMSVQDFHNLRYYKF